MNVTFDWQLEEEKQAGLMASLLIIIKFKMFFNKSISKADSVIRACRESF
jgi:hypothetical protein